MALFRATHISHTEYSRFYCDQKWIFCHPLWITEMRRNMCQKKQHWDEASYRPKLAGMNLVIELPQSQYGSAIHTRLELVVKIVVYSHNSQIDVLTIVMCNCRISLVYKLLIINFAFEKPTSFDNCETKIVMGDYNSHNTM